jgi:hypothetical protein
LGLWSLVFGLGVLFWRTETKGPSPKAQGQRPKVQRSKSQSSLSV